METILRITDNTDLVQMTIHNGEAVKEKTLKIRDVQKVFTKTMESYYYRPISLFSGREEIVDGLLAGMVNDTKVTGIFFIPGSVRYLNFAGESKAIPYPTILFYLESLDGTIRGAKVLVVEETDISKLKEDTPLYAFPFGNVDPSNASVCWGSNYLSGFSGYKGLQEAVTIFFSSESNTDYVRKGTSFKGYANYMAFLKALDGKSIFPKKALVPSSCFPTLGALLSLV